MYNTDHISTYIFSHGSVFFFFLCLHSLSSPFLMFYFFLPLHLLDGTILCKLFLHKFFKSLFNIFHYAFPHYFQWFHPNSCCVCKIACTFISLGPILFAKQSAGAALSHYQLYYLNYCVCSATSEHCYWRLHQDSLLCCSLGLWLGLDPTKICCQYPSWPTLACLNAFIMQEGFSNAEAWVHGRAFCHNTLLLFPLRDHNHWKT